LLLEQLIIIKIQLQLYLAYSKPYPISNSSGLYKLLGYKMARKLKQFISCDIYRDGGSLSAKWVDDESNDWFITLHINDWDNPDDIKTYRLFNCNINEIEHHSQIMKNSSEHLEITNLLENWILVNQINLDFLQQDLINDNRLYDLLQELKKEIINKKKS